jgi:hypothetical protein
MAIPKTVFHWSDLHGPAQGVFDTIRQDLRSLAAAGFHEEINKSFFYRYGSVLHSLIEPLFFVGVVNVPGDNGVVDLAVVGENEGPKYRLIKVGRPDKELLDEGGQPTPELDFLVDQALSWRRRAMEEDSVLRKNLPVADPDEGYRLMVLGGRRRIITDIMGPNFPEHDGVSLVSFGDLGPLLEQHVYSDAYASPGIDATAFQVYQLNQLVNPFKMFVPFSTWRSWLPTLDLPTSGFLERGIDTILGDLRYNEHFAAFRRAVEAD